MAQIFKLRETDAKQDVVELLEQLLVQARSGRIQGTLIVAQSSSGEQRVSSGGSLAIETAVLAGIVSDAIDKVLHPEAATQRSNQASHPDELPLLLRSS